MVFKNKISVYVYRYIIYVMYGACKELRAIDYQHKDFWGVIWARAGFRNGQLGSCPGDATTTACELIIGIEIAAQRLRSISVIPALRSVLDQGSRSDRVLYHAHICWLSLASVAPCCTPCRDSSQPMTSRVVILWCWSCKMVLLISLMT